MNDSSSPKEDRAVVSKWMKHLVCWSLLLFCLLILGFPYTEIVFQLFTGWTDFPGRVFPQINWDFALFASGFLALFMAAWGFHRIATSFRSGWKKSWTAAWILTGGLMFSASIFTTGMAHQTAWLIREPLIVKRSSNRNNHISNLRQILLALRVYHADQDSFPERLYELYPDYIIDVPLKDSNFWTIKEKGKDTLEILYFPEVLQLPKFVNEEELIVVASPSLSGRRYAGLLNGSVRIMSEKDFGKLLTDQQKALFQTLEDKHRN